MYQQENIKPYGKSGEKGKLVEKMFDNIADHYDFLNHGLSWNIDKGWRRKAIKRLERFHPQVILDIATGTGDFAMLAARTLCPKQVIGADISEGMMAVGKKKVAEANLQDIVTFQKEDSLHMSFADNSFDAVTVAFGIRNFQDLDKGLREICRVLKPNGHLVIIELTTPISFPMKQLFKLYSHTFLPAYAHLISKDKSAYQYLTATIEAFPHGEQLMGILRKAGFKETTFKRMTFGICTLCVATK